MGGEMVCGHSDITKLYSGPEQPAWVKSASVLPEHHGEKVEPWEVCERGAQWFHAFPLDPALRGGPPLSRHAINTSSHMVKPTRDQVRSMDRRQREWEN